MPLLLRPFQPADQDACKALVLAGLVDHWGFLDPTLNPDLNDIAASYAAGFFLTAWHGPRLVGTGAFLPADARTVQAARVSVARDLRGQGIGRAIMAELRAEALRRGCRRMILETTASWDEVVRFYLGLGFTITHRAGEELYFEAPLSAA